MPYIDDNFRLHLQVNKIIKAETLDQKCPCCGYGDIFFDWKLDLYLCFFCTSYWNLSEAIFDL